MPRRDFASLHLLPPSPCCQLDPCSQSLVASSPPCPCRATPRVNSEPLEPLQTLGADERKDKTKSSSSLACLHSPSLRPAPSQPQDCSSTICSLLLPKRPERERGGEPAALGAWFRMEATF